MEQSEYVHDLFHKMYLNLRDWDHVQKQLQIHSNHSMHEQCSSQIFETQRKNIIPSSSSNAF